jgi:hypothetical protein
MGNELRSLDRGLPQARFGFAPLATRHGASFATSALLALVLRSEAADPEPPKSQVTLPIRLIA